MENTSRKRKAASQLTPENEGYMPEVISSKKVETNNAQKRKPRAVLKKKESTEPEIPKGIFKGFKLVGESPPIITQDVEQELKALNESFLESFKNAVEKNPSKNMSFLFSQYLSYVTEIQSKDKKVTSTDEKLDTPFNSNKTITENIFAVPNMNMNKKTSIKNSVNPKAEFTDKTPTNKDINSKVCDKSSAVMDSKNKNVCKFIQKTKAFTYEGNTYVPNGSYLLKVESINDNIVMSLYNENDSLFINEPIKKLGYSYTEYNNFLVIRLSSGKIYSIEELEPQNAEILKECFNKI